jgi:hypothetical protein
MGSAQNIDAIDLVEMKPVDKPADLASIGNQRVRPSEPLCAQGDASRQRTPDAFD